MQTLTLIELEGNEVAVQSEGTRYEGGKAVLRSVQEKVEWVTAHRLLHGTIEESKALTRRILAERPMRPSMDDDEMRQTEPGQTYVRYNFIR